VNASLLHYKNKNKKKQQQKTTKKRERKFALKLLSNGAI
jgi:hypothetical protein